MIGRKLVIALATALICNLASGQVSNPRNLKVLCFGNSSHIMFVDFKEAIDTSAVLKTAATTYNLETVDPDNPGEFATYLPVARAFPCFIAMNQSGDYLAKLTGFVDSEELMSFFSKLDTLSSEPYSKESMENLYKKWCKKIKKTERYNNMIAAGRFYDFQVGGGYAFLSGDAVESRSGLVMTAGMSFRQHIKGTRLFLCGGPALDCLPKKEFRLRLPVDAEIFLGRTYPFDWRVRAGGWGGYSLNNWDAGLSTSIVAEMGSFDFSIGYVRGLIDRNPAADASSFSNMVIASVRLRIGD